MGSTQPESDPPLLFGYNVDPNQEPIFDAPEPAPGAPILSDTDNKFLSSFFEDITANQYNMPSFGGEGLMFSDSWLDLPPQLMGTATSLGQQDGTPLASPNTNALHGHLSQDPRSAPTAHMMPPPPPHSHAQQQHTSDEILTAAAMLLQNGPASSSSSDALDSRRPPPVGHLRHQGLEEFKQDGQGGLSAADNDNIFKEWAYGTRTRPYSRDAPPSDFQWGSDSSFNPAQGFTPVSKKDTFESMSQEHLKCLECLEVSKSTDTTRPNSPINGQSALSSNHNLSGLAKRPEDVDAPPRKRRKSKNMKDAAKDGDDEDAAALKALKQKKKSEREKGTSSPNDDAATSGKGRKSAASLAKAARENLSEGQKRENHIKSEQRRRTLIKEGFDDLCELVPGLRGGGFSKSTMLAMAAEWLEDMLQGNEILSKQLASTGPR